MARYHMTEAALAIIARRISKEITIRTYVDGTSEDITSEANNHQQEILHKIAFGALLGLNWGGEVVQSKSMEQAILDSSEFTLMQFIPGVNGYDSLYNKLRAVLEAWKAHERTPSEWSLRKMWELFPEEMSCLDDWLAYADMDEITTIDNVEDATIQCEEMKKTLEDADEIFPEDLENPHILMMLWNQYVKTPNAVSVGC